MAEQAKASAPALVVRDVSYAYGPRQALDVVDITVRHGRFTALLGPNGAGKTTLFSLITRLFDTQHGWIEIEGQTLAQAGARALAPIGVVFQQPTLDLDLTVRQNLRYFGALRGLSRRRIDERASALLGALDMGERVAEKVRTLNGGHRRRVEIARALLHRPRLLLLDEPTVGLDVPTRADIVSHIHKLARDEGLAVLWATHLIDEIEPEDDLVVLHQGKVIAQGRADDVVTATGEPDLEGAFRALIGTERAAA